MQGGGRAVPRTWLCLSPKPHGVELTIETALDRWAGCLVFRVSTLGKPCRPLSPATGISLSSWPLGAIYSPHVPAPPGAPSSRINRPSAEGLCPAPSAPVAGCAGSARLFVFAPAPARKCFLGKMAAASVCEPPVGGFSFDNCRRFDYARARVQGGSGSALPGSEPG